MTTESALREWRYGQTQAERMVAALLHLEGFEAVDPQHPLGGPDGLKDVLCCKDGLSWVAAAYFPSTLSEFRVIKSKFEHDIEGVRANNASAFAFFVNQPLTIGEREQLLGLAGQSRVELYHLERIRSVLDAPKGCGIRLEYLRISMTDAEQWSFWSSMNQDIVRKLVDHEKRRESQIRTLDEKLDLIIERTNAIGFALLEKPSHLRQKGSAPENPEMPTASLSLTTLCWLHRVITEDSRLPEAVRGRLRSVNVWVGPAGSTPETATYVPPVPEQLVDLTNSWIVRWQEQHSRLQASQKEEVVATLAEFHHEFLCIHPFLDANGRLARILLDQAARELLNQGIGSEFTADAVAYYSALNEADGGNLAPLIARVSASLK
ncbi:Fic family protein [Pseudomonas sp. B21-048]|uniref:Fic family protein n=1 Tax=Pseudomonas sp. B21-048 TaxID=2895490 RepID=UPI00215F86B3|nr:Fic family protein [Pseudomonas sp. B21-048]UVL00521.1 Fic family protein [Pseudomonas sp. B21-048]